MPDRRVRVRYSLTLLAFSVKHYRIVTGLVTTV